MRGTVWQRRDLMRTFQCVQDGECYREIVEDGCRLGEACDDTVWIEEVSANTQHNLKDSLLWLNTHTGVIVKLNSAPFKWCSLHAGVNDHHRNTKVEQISNQNNSVNKFISI